jgi:hypothetical protein
MFDKMRDAVKNSILVKILMGALIVSFGVFGIGDFLGTGSLDPNIALKVGEREVNVIEFQRDYDRRYATFTHQLDGKRRAGPRRGRQRRPAAHVHPRIRSLQGHHRHLQPDRI